MTDDKTFQSYCAACRLADRQTVWAALRGAADQPAAFPLIRAGEPVVLSSVAISNAYQKRYGA